VGKKSKETASPEEKQKKTMGKNPEARQQGLIKLGGVAVETITAQERGEGRGQAASVKKDTLVRVVEEKGGGEKILVNVSQKKKVKNRNHQRSLVRTASLELVEKREV